MCEFPYEFDTVNSRTRFMMTTANGDGVEELPRINTAQGGRPMRMSYGTMTGQGSTSASGFASVGQYGGRGLSAGA